MIKYYNNKYNLIKAMDDYKGFFLKLQELDLYSINDITLNFFTILPFIVTMDSQNFYGSSKLDYKTPSPLEVESKGELSVEAKFRVDFLTIMDATFEFVLSFLKNDIYLYQSKEAKVIGNYILDIKTIASSPKAKGMFVSSNYEFEMYGKILNATLNFIESIGEYKSNIDIDIKSLASFSLEAEMLFKLYGDIKAGTQALQLFQFDIEMGFILDIGAETNAYNISNLDKITIGNYLEIKKAIIRALQTRLLKINKIKFINAIDAKMKYQIFYILKSHDGKTLKDMDINTLNELSNATLS